MSYEMRVKDTQGAEITWLVRAVMAGDGYGQWEYGTQGFALTHGKEEPLVEFYDTRGTTFQPFGAQFVSRYYLSTLLERSSTAGLDLQGGVPSWSISAEALQQVLAWLRDLFLPSDSNKTSRKTDLILASLRCLQHCKEPGVDLSFLEEIIETDSIDPEEIEALCETINFE